MIGLSLAKHITLFKKKIFCKPMQQFIINLGNPSLAAKKKQEKNPKKPSDYVKTNIRTEAASDYHELNVNASNSGFVY